MHEQLRRMYRSYHSLCRRMRRPPTVNEQVMVAVYLRYLPRDLGLQVRESAPDEDLDTLYAAARFAAKKEGRKSLLPMPQDIMCGDGSSEAVEGLFPLEFEPVGRSQQSSSWPPLRFAPRDEQGRDPRDVYDLVRVRAETPYRRPHDTRQWRRTNAASRSAPARRMPRYHEQCRWRPIPPRSARCHHRGYSSSRGRPLRWSPARHRSGTAARHTLLRRMK